MNLRKKELINLAVYTQLGQYLGKVVDFELESSSQTIIKYYVRSKDIIKELLNKELLISKDQVITISEKKMIVEDGVILQKEKKQILKKVVSSA